MAEKFDHIVVGGGTAGAVVAARLSEERGSRVLLLEAGPDYPDTVPRELLDASFAVTSGYNWNMQAIRGQESPAPGQRARISKVFERASSFLGEQHLGQAREIPQNTSFPYLSGKVMGGGSAINGCLALHARPEDYAAWTATGLNDWSWERIRPFIHRIATADSNKPALPMETPSSQDLTRCQKAFLDACYGLGTRRVDIQQGLIGGVGSIPKSVRGGQRVSTSTLYLAAARNRENLTIQSNCLANKLLLERTNGSLTATAVETVINGARTRFSGGQITVTAGAINSPALLMRSGIGTAAELVRSNVKPLLDLPGVGKNLQDHCSVSIWATPRQGACVAGEPVHQLMLQQRSTTSKSLCDIQLYMLSAVRTHHLPGLRQMADSDLALGIAAVLATPQSRGHLEIVSDDASTNPRIYLNCLQDPGDLRRMMEAVRSAWHIIRREPLQSHIDRFLLWTQSIVDSDTLLENLVRATVRTTWHPVGTLRMGPESDPLAAVDRYGRLYGCRNVTIADASIMPAIPSVPLNLTCMLIGERIAAHLRGLEA